MSTRREHPRLLLLAGFAFAGAAILAAAAFAFVQIYKNPFNNRSQYNEIQKVSGKKCGRAFKEERELMQVKAREGPASCSYKLPVQGSGPRPDHRFEAEARLLRDTHSSIREDAYLSMGLRVGSGKRYELRVDSKDREFELRRKPGGAMFPVAGHNGAITGVGRLNRLRLIAVNDRIRAFVNGTKVADVVDPSPGQVDGAKVYFGVGNQKQTGRKTIANFDLLRLKVPTP